MFAFRRGGIVWGKSIQFGVKTTLSGTNATSQIGDGVFFSYESDNYRTYCVDSVVCPYFANIPWVPNEIPGYNFASEIRTDLINEFKPSRLRSEWIIDQFTMISAADDALFMFPVPNFPYYFGVTDFSAGFIPGP